MAVLTLLVGVFAACGRLDELRDFEGELEETDEAAFPAERFGAGEAEAQRYVDAGERPAPDAGIVVSDAGNDVGGARPDASELEDAFFGELGDEDDAEVLAPPTIFAVFPAIVPAEGGGLITIEGSGFGLSTEISVSGEVWSVVDVIDEFTMLVVTEPLAAGAHALKVTNGAGSAVLPNALLAVAQLDVAGVDPPVVGTEGGAELVLDGQGFLAQTRFLVDGREATVLERTSSEEVRLLAPARAAPGEVDIVAFDDRFARLRAGLTYADAPALERVVPNLASAGAPTTVRLEGAGLGQDCSALVNGAVLPVFQARSDTWNITVPGGAPGPADIALDCGERGSDWLPAGLIFLEGATMSVQSAYPPAVFARGGARVVLEGVGLADVDSVVFVTAEGESEGLVLEASRHAVEVLVPALTPGPASVRVSDGNGAASIEIDLLDSLLFGSFDPPSGPPEGGWTTVLGAIGADAVDGVRVDGREVPFTRVGQGLRIVAPPGVPGPAAVRVDIGPIALDPGASLRYQGPFAVHRSFPNTASTTGGTLVYVAGDGFDERCVVRIDGVEAATDVLGSALLVAVAPPHAAGNATLEVSGCGEWSGGSLRYIDPRLEVGGVAGGAIDGELYVSVIEAGTNQPIEGATVRVGIRESDPLVALTDANGQAAFVDERLVGPQTVTAFAPDRSTESYVGVNASEITLLLAQPPPPPCDPTVEDCSPPPPPPNGRIIGFLTGLEKVADPPPGAYLAAYVETTRLTATYPNPDPGPDAYLLEDGPFDITTRLGDMALVALCGWEFTGRNDFVAQSIGVVRGIQQREDEDPVRLAVDCDIDLTESATFKLVDAPALATEEDARFPLEYRASAAFDFGAEGFFVSLPTLYSDQTLFTGGTYPPLEGVIGDVTVDFTAGAYPLQSTIPSAIAYQRFLRSYEGVLTFPGLLDVPTLTYPSAEDPRLVDNYIEWAVDPSTRTPDFYFLSVSSGEQSFSRWSVFVPGYQTSINLAEFPDFSEAVGGAVPGPGEARVSLSIYVRALDVDVFDYDDFDRTNLRSRNWRAVSSNFSTVTLQEAATE